MKKLFLVLSVIMCGTGCIEITGYDKKVKEGLW